MRIHTVLSSLFLFSLLASPGFAQDRCGQVRYYRDNTLFQAWETQMDRASRASDAIGLMQRHRIDEIPVVDADHRVVGVIDIQDLLAKGFSVFDNA